MFALRGSACALGDFAEDEEGGGDEAEACPEVVKAEALAHVDHGEDGEDDHGDDFLDDFELAERVGLEANTVGGDLEAVFEEGDAPAKEDRDEEGPVFEVFEVAVPGIGHEEVGAGEEENGGDARHFVFILPKTGVGRGAGTAKERPPGALAYRERTAIQ